MNPRISEKINYLSEFICNEIDEDSLVSNGRRLIEELRDEWKLNRLDFSDENVKSLRRITLLLDEIEDFIFEQQDFQYISSKEEIDEATGRLQYILTNTSNLKIFIFIKIIWLIIKILIKLKIKYERKKNINT